MKQTRKRACNDPASGVRSAAAQGASHAANDPHRLLLETRVADEFQIIRHRLHDGLGQLLTSMSFLASSLRQKLAERGLDETADVDEILTLLAKAASESRALALECQRQPGISPPTAANP